ncbi:Bacterial extracellular solute-binding protein [Maioricimonas rarisocia]|uniref:Bacterial extracellular solute-binding protein n=2 Tax=Maioricimonas rarisocia TaxID=2528026 RepID=A0A517Z637_9PLAN|nr:Bacterial extracellular solute-binding protein [Maioricimonas rarisocia]
MAGLYVLMGLLLAGCPGGNSTQAPQEPAVPSLAGEEITLTVVGTVGESTTWDLAISEWEAATGANCVRNTLENANPASIEPVVAETPGLLVLPLLSLPDLMQAGIVATVPEEVARSPQSPWQELFDGLRRGVAAPQERTTNLPLAAPPLLLWYRADLFERAELQPPRTWEEYDALVASIAEWGDGAFAAEPWEGDFAATMLMARAASSALHPDNFSFYLDVSTGEPLIDREPFVRTLQRVVDSRRAEPGQLQLLSRDACWTALIAGEAAMAVSTGPVSTGQGQAPQAGATRPEGIRLAAVPLPGSNEAFDHETGEWQPLDQTLNRVTVVGQGGYTVCVARSAGEELRQASWNLWETIEAAERDNGFRGDYWTLCRASQSGLFASRMGILHGLEQTQFSDAVAASLREPRVVLDIALPQREVFAHLLAEAVHRVFEDDATPAEALKEAADAWAAQAQQIGPAHVLNTCRAAMGLSPMPALDR